MIAQDKQEILSAINTICLQVKNIAGILLEQEAPPAPAQPEPQPTPEPVENWGSGKAFPGKPTQFGVQFDKIAIPGKYHAMGREKRLSSRETSPIVFETSSKHYFLAYVSPLDDGRHLYEMPPKPWSGAFKVLWSNDRNLAWPHEYARISFKEGKAYSPKFRTVNAHGRTVNARGR